MEFKDTGSPNFYKNTIKETFWEEFAESNDYYFRGKYILMKRIEHDMLSRFGSREQLVNEKRDPISEQASSSCIGAIV